MPSGKKSDSLQHNSFTSLNVQNQSKLNGTLVDSNLSCKLLEASSTNIIPSNNEVTSSSKRSIQDDLDFNTKIKKFKESKEEQSSLNNEKCIEDHHISLLIEKLDKIAESDIVYVNKHNNVSNESNNGNSEKDICINDPIKSDSNNQEICSSKVSVSKDGSQNIETKSDNVNNDINNCVPQAMKINTESTKNNDDIENNHQLIRPSSSENLIDEDVEDSSLIKIIESSKNNDDIENNHQLIRPSSSENLLDEDVDSSIIKNIDLQLYNNNIAQMSTKSTNEIETIENEPENNKKVENEISNINGDINGEMIESDNGSGSGSVIVDDFDGSNTNKESDCEDEISNVNTTQHMKNLATSVLFQLFSEKDNVCERWGSFVKFKCIEYLTDKDVRGRERREAEHTMRLQNTWIEKYTVLLKTLSNYEVLVKNHVAKLKNVPKQIKTCRSVALQADLLSLEDKDSFVKQQNQVQKKLKLNQLLPQFDSSPVDISSDDDDVILVEPTIKPSSSNIEINTKAKQYSSTCKSISSSIPSTSKKLMVSTTKAVPPAIPIKSVINPVSIDLTGNDEENEVPQKLNLDKGVKVVRCSKINTNASSVSTQLTRNLSTHALPKNVTLVETSQLPTSSHYVVKKSTATASNQLTAASNLKTVRFEPNSSVQPIAIKPSRKFLHLSPVVDSNQLQPSTSTVTLTSHQINCLASQLNRPQTMKPQPTKSPLIRSQVAMVQSTRPQLAMAQSTRTQLAMAQSTTRPQISMVQSTARPRISMVQSTRPQQSRPLLLPVPPAIPLKITHPAPLPPLPNQTSLPSWKQLPSAPVLTATEKGPGEVVLSWVVPRYTRPSVSAIVTYQIFGYNNVSSEVLPNTSYWKEIGTATALPLPMACTLTELNRPQTCFFAIRAIDIHTRVGPFSLPKMVNLR